ncbi:MAG: hypothetical protein HC896_07700 [Bacteroidales bacterium]|nr:hypothetical protein [Bacteroidales bacterium]
MEPEQNIEKARQKGHLPHESAGTGELHQSKAQAEELKRQVKDLEGQVRALQTEASIQQKVENRIIGVNKKLFTFIAQTSLAFIEWNAQLEVIRWNHAAESLFGYKKKRSLPQKNAFSFGSCPSSQRGVGGLERTYAGKQQQKRGSA